LDGAFAAPPADRVSEPEEPRPSDREGVGHRLDPDLAASLARGERRTPDGAQPDQPPPGPPTPPTPRPVLDTGRYRSGLGIFGLAVVVVVSIYLFATHGIGTTGVPTGQRLHPFAAPLANSTLDGLANTQNPTCSLAHHDPRALNTCLILRRTPLVLSFFDAGSSSCVGQVDALQRLSVQLAPGSVQFAAVAVGASHSATRALVRSHHWTIPVAYDSGGQVRQAFGIAVCPLAELVQRGGIVSSRLIGDHWRTSAELAPLVRALVASGRAGGVGR
jgi:AhpC/TSA family